MRGWGLLGIIAVLVSITLSPVIGEELQAPYLYYWSDYHHAFIIERADGTDQHALGQGLSYGANAGGAGWSPSGEWLAWATSRRDPVSRYFRVLEAKPFILSADGQRKVTVTDHLINAYEMVWHPTQDILLVVESFPENPHYQFTLYLIDVNANAIIASYRHSNTRVAMTVPTWQPNGAYVAMYLAADNDDDAETLVMLGVNGEVVEQPAHQFYYGGVPSPFHDTYQAQLFAPDGTLTYLNEDRTTVLLQKTMTSQAQAIPIPRGKIISIWWSTTGDYALIRSIQRGQTDKLATTVFHWLFDNKAITLTPFKGDIAQSMQWMPNHNAVFFLDTQQNAVLYDVDTHTQQIILENTEIKYWQWLDDNHLASSAFEDYRIDLSESVKNRKLTYKRFYEAYLYEVDATILTKLDVLTSESEYYPEDALAISTDLQYEASMTDGTTIRNYATGEEILIDPHAARHVMGFHIGLIEWHPQGNWFITVANNTIAGGGPNYELWQVANADGSVVRDLTFCQGSQCVNWIPAQVNPANLPPLDTVLHHDPEPVHVIPTDDFVTTLEWSPDSQLLAIGHGFFIQDDYPSWSYIWNMDTQSMDDPLAISETATLQWEQTESGHYSALFQEAETPIELPLRFTTSPDGQQYIAASDWTSGYGVHDAYTDYPLALFPLEGLEEAYQAGFSYSPDGRWLVGGIHGDRVRVWDPETGILIITLNIFGTGVAFSPDGQWLAIGSGWDVKLYQVADLFPPQ